MKCLMLVKSKYKIIKKEESFSGVSIKNCSVMFRQANMHHTVKHTAKLNMQELSENQEFRSIFILFQCCSLDKFKSAQTPSRKPVRNIYGLLFCGFYFNKPQNRRRNLGIPTPCFPPNRCLES